MTKYYPLQPNLTIMMRKLLLLCHFLLIGTVLQLAAQERTVTGRVTAAEDGAALPGVNVVVKGFFHRNVTMHLAATASVLATMQP
jgi:hypothetical protein